MNSRMIKVRIYPPGVPVQGRLRPTPTKQGVKMRDGKLYHYFTDGSLRRVRR